jgi:hypothetical protein
MARLAVVLIHIALTTVLTFSADALAEAFPTVEPADPAAETVTPPVAPVAPVAPETRLPEEAPHSRADAESTAVPVPVF